MSSEDSASWAKFRSELATRASAPPRPAGLPRGSPPRLPRAVKGSPARQSVAQLLFRHHAVVAESSRALLRLLQTALRENAALASRTDESLLGTFQAYVDAALAEALRNAPAGAAPAARAVAASAAVSEAALPFR